jgi:hypothetical protein
MIARGYKIASGGTDNHLMLVDLRTKFPELTAKKAQETLDLAHITCNKNTVPFETRSPFQASGIRLGTPAVTTRGFVESDMAEIAACIDTVLAAIGTPGEADTLSAVKAHVSSAASRPAASARPLSLGVIFLTLYIDLIGFSIIFPLGPDLLEHYLKLEGHTGVLGWMVAQTDALARTAGIANYAPVLFGGLLSSFFSILQFIFAPFWGSLSDRRGRSVARSGCSCCPAWSAERSAVISRLRPQPSLTSRHARSVPRRWAWSGRPSAWG